MLALLLVAVSFALFVVPPVRAVDLPTVAHAAEQEQLPTAVDDALYQPKIVHPG